MIAKTMIEMVNCYLSDSINLGYKLIKKYMFNKLEKLYTWSRFRSKNTYPLDKCYKNTALLFYNW